MSEMKSGWVLLVTNLPGRNQTLRMRIWRALKAAGAVLLRDGAYLLPLSTSARQIFQEQCAEIQQKGGIAHLLVFNSESAAQQDEFVKLFDRTNEFKVALTQIAAYQRELAKMTEHTARRRFAALTREIAAMAATDFFAGESQTRLRNALAGAEAAFIARFEPDEPHPAQRSIERRDRKDFRARTWATREHLWIDRVCSAWLIRRFIDPKARFVWLKRPVDRPRKAIGFDFDGAEFTHVGSQVTFEVLLTSFALEQDPGLARLGAMAHHLDVGGAPVTEAPGFAAIMTGARALQPDDDALLKTMTPVLDALYAAYGTPEK